VTLNEARELRQELEAINALMQGVLEKAQQLPSVDELDDLAQQVAFLSGHLDNIVEQSGKLAAGALKGLQAEAGDHASGDECVIAKAEEPRP
jgi:hypothetical protein